MALAHTPDWQGGSARFLVTTKRRCIAHQGRSARSHSGNTRPRGRANCPLDNRTRHRRKGCQPGTCPQGYPRSDRCRGSFRPRPSTRRIGKLITLNMNLCWSARTRTRGMSKFKPAASVRRRRKLQRHTAEGEHGFGYAQVSTSRAMGKPVRGLTAAATGGTQ